MRQFDLVTALREPRSARGACVHLPVSRNIAAIVDVAVAKRFLSALPVSLLAIIEQLDCECKGWDHRIQL